ncbi:MAG: YgjP-like metallopeptidase domain-containing protein [Candidatus Nitrosopolaris sp.]
MLSLPVHLSNGRTLSVQVKKSKRAKRLCLKANIFGIHVVVPMINYEIDEVMRFLDIKKDWILQTSEYYGRLRNKYGEENLKLNTISFLGKRYNLRITKDVAGSVIVSDNLKIITFHVSDRRRYKDDVKRWYFTQTNKILSERLALVREMKPDLPTYNKVTIKDQRSRWASCSKNGNLNFNLLLASLPVELIDYVIIHELAHLIELNHSKEFWKIVKSIDPEFQYHRKLLHKYGVLTNYVQ